LEGGASFGVAKRVMQSSNVRIIVHHNLHADDVAAVVVGAPDDEPSGAAEVAVVAVDAGAGGLVIGCPLSVL
jgi:hypothetical protein